MPAKYTLHNQLSNVKGTVLWYAKAAVDNVGNYGSMLRNVYWKYPALQPSMPFIDGKAPKKVKRMKVLNIDGDMVLFWTAPSGKSWKDMATKYVVYRFEKGQKTDISNPMNIITITSDTYLKLPYQDGTKEYTYVVTALDRMQNESKAVKKKVKL